MDPERNSYSNKDKQIIRNSESLLINTSLGLYKDESNGLFIIDSQTLTSQTLIPSDTVQTLKIGNLQISHSVTENKDIAITIESDTEISAIKCLYRFPFEKKFAYEKAKREAEQGAT